MITNQTTPEKLLPYLDEIARQLHSGHAAVMIGAGFSKNAETNNSNKKKFPDWRDLGDVFYKKIHNKLPNSDNDGNYLNVLKLADEVESMFGRPRLNEILKTEIPDEDYEPSKLHTKLLEFPWVDVFTTNYDTLLERAATKIYKPKYETITNKDDLILSTKPRIIKLHGSFPSSRPFIITEEDYRTYPKKFAPFVNTVQQSLLENTLCLIGFSGDDPNFLNWIGWIRDNLENDNSLKIYLIGIFSLSEGSRKLLENKNIITIDLSLYQGVNENSPKERLNIFFKDLNKKIIEFSNINWNKQKQIKASRITDRTLNDNIEQIITDWKEIRTKYPNWLIMPREKR